MGIIWTPTGPYHLAGYQSESDLELSILQVRGLLFGVNRIYLPIKKKIGMKGSVRNIPDGYLIDLTGKKPRLYVVENELAAHDPLRHIAVQILQFSLSFESEGRGVKSIIFSALQNHVEYRSKCEAYAANHQFRNLDHLLEYLVFECPFAALVIIDELPENLENVLAKKFQFGVEVLELSRYENDAGENLFRFEPFLADLSQDVAPLGDLSRNLAPGDTDEVDTVVVPAQADGAAEVFLGENRWHEIRVHATMRPQIKYIALYQVAPISAITHIAPVKSIEPWKETGKYVVNFSSPAEQIGPITLVKHGRVKALQNLRYTTRARLDMAKTLDDIW
jgi:hypothetical protein